MRILHTSDWHIGKKYGNISRFDEQVGAMDEICAIAELEKVDAVIIAGDIYDNFNPSIEATELFYRTLRKLSRNGETAVIVIAGNHDSPDRIEVSDPLALELGIILAGYPSSKVREFSTTNGVSLLQSDEGFAEIKLPHCDYPLRLILAPYATELRLKKYLGGDGDEGAALGQLLEERWKELAGKYCDPEGVNVLVSHLFMMKKGGEKPEESDEERSISLGGADLLYSSIIPLEIQYAALGHIHKPWTIDKEICPISYCGSPIAYGLNEAGQDKFIHIVDIEPGKAAVISKRQILSGRPIRKGKFSDYAEAVKWLEENRKAIVELTFETQTFITAEMRQGFDEAYNAPVTINLPRYDSDINSSETHAIADKSMEEMFKDYFISKKGNEPNEDIMALFWEILADREGA